MVLDGAGRSAGLLDAGQPVLSKLPSIHCRNAAYCTAVTVSHVFAPGWAEGGRRGAPASGLLSSSSGGLEFSSISSSPMSAGMLAGDPAVRLVSDGGRRRKSSTRLRSFRRGAELSESFAQSKLLWKNWAGACVKAVFRAARSTGRMSRTNSGRKVEKPLVGLKSAFMARIQSGAPDDAGRPHVGLRTETSTSESCRETMLRIPGAKSGGATSTHAASMSSTPSFSPVDNSISAVTGPSETSSNQVGLLA